jgi:hypothetical protein
LASPAQSSTIGLELYLGYGDLSYSGQAVYNNGAVTYAGPLHRAPGYQRFDYFYQGREVVALADVQAGMVFTQDMLGNEQNLGFAEPYLQRLFPMVGYFPAFSEELAAEAEMANGVETTRYAVQGVGHDDTAFAGDVWVAQSGAVIMARIDYGELQVTFDLYDYQPGPQDPALFDLGRDEQPI